MVVYADSVFLLNSLIDYLLLAGCARLSGVNPRRWRMLLAAAFGGLYAVGCVIPALAVLRAWPFRLAALGGMVVLAFGASGHAIWQGCLLLAVSFALGGCLTALALSLGVRLQLLAGTVCYALDFPTLVLASGCLYAVAALLFSGLGGHAGGDLIAAAATVGGRTIRFTALRDTGNTLRDPISGRSVLVADFDLLQPILPVGMTRESLRSPEQAMLLCAALHPRLIPYRAVGVQSAMLLAIRADTLTLGKRMEQNALIALSPTPVSDGGAYRALTGGE